jgi:hypothetical protein
MKILIVMLGALLGVMLAPDLASATTYVNTAGQVLAEENLGSYCRPTEKINDDRIMVYSTTESDGRILRARMIESGVSDEATLQKWQQMAQANACQRGAGLNCTGACPPGKGSCQTEVKGNYTGCACK